MKQYLTKFSTRAAYEAELSNLDFPNVSYISGDDELVYAESGSSPTHDYSLDYFTIEAIDDNLSFQIGDTENPTLYFSLDDGATWTNDAIFSLSSGEKALLKNTGAIDYETSPFEVTGGRFNLEGNIMSLIYGDDFADKTDFGNYNEVFRQFADYTGVVNAGNLVLPATTLRGGCYESMFEGCTSLTTAPVLPATTLDVSCYSGMFNGCTSLNYIKMLATDISAEWCLRNWVGEVAESGTFIKDASMTTLPTGDSGIPSGWTVVDA